MYEQLKVTLFWQLLYGAIAESAVGEGARSAFLMIATILTAFVAIAGLRAYLFFSTTLVWTESVSVFLAIVATFCAQLVAGGFVRAVFHFGTDFGDPFM